MNDDTNVKLKWFGIPKLLPFVKKYKVRIIWMVILGVAASLIDSIYPLFNQVQSINAAEAPFESTQIILVCRNRSAIERSFIFEFRKDRIDIL